MEVSSGSSVSLDSMLGGAGRRRPYPMTSESLAGYPLDTGSSDVGGGGGRPYPRSSQSQLCLPAGDDGDGFWELVETEDETTVSDRLGFGPTPSRGSSLAAVSFSGGPSSVSSSTSESLAAGFEEAALISVAEDAAAADEASQIARLQTENAALKQTLSALHPNLHYVQ